MYPTITEPFGGNQCSKLPESEGFNRQPDRELKESVKIVRK